MTVQALVEEKETRAKETMYIMGLKSWVFSISWATTYLVRFGQFLFQFLFSCLHFPQLLSYLYWLKDLLLIVIKISESSLLMDALFLQAVFLLISLSVTLLLALTVFPRR